MTLDSAETHESYTRIDNFTYYKDVRDLNSALEIQRQFIESEGVDPERCTLVLDFDGPLAKELSIQAIVGYSLERLQQLRQFLIEYPKTSVAILTSRHIEYGWGFRIKWLLAIQEVLAEGIDYDPLLIENHSLAYDPKDDLYWRVAMNRLIIGGAGKDKATRFLEVIVGHRSVWSFLKHDVLRIHPELVEKRLILALKAIFAAREEMGGGMVTIIDDGVMLPYIEALASHFTDIDIVYIHMTESPVGRISTLTRGIIGALAYGLRNRRSRELRELKNP